MYHHHELALKDKGADFQLSLLNSSRLMWVRDWCIKVLATGSTGLLILLTRLFYVPGCCPSQLHQAQAHLPGLLMEDFTETNKEEQQ